MRAVDRASRQPGAVAAALGACLALGACSDRGGGIGSAAPPPQVLAVDRVLDPTAPQPFVIAGADFPGAGGTPVTIRLTAVDGLPLADCGTPTTALGGSVTSATTIAAVLPAFVLTRDVATFVAIEFPGGIVAASPAPIAQLTGHADDVHDHDGDGVVDGCDPKTYTFDGAAIGSRPDDLTALDGDGQPALRIVATPSGTGAAFVGSGAVAYERFDRLDADFPSQDTTVLIDLEPSGNGTMALELGSEGSRQGGAGYSVTFGVAADRRTVFQERFWRDVVQTTVGPQMPANGRMRLRLRKGTATSSALHLDGLVGGVWQDDLFVYAIADDRICRGLEIAASNDGGGARAIRRLTVVRELPTRAFALARSPARATDHQVFQRGDDGTAAIPLRLLYRLPAGGTAGAWIVRSATGAPVPGFGLGEHVLALPARSTGRFDFVLPRVPAGGNYDVMVGVLDAAGNAVGVESLHEVAVGDVYVAAGQSNMSGASGTLAGTEPPSPLAHLFHNDGSWQPAREPMDGGELQTDLVSFDQPSASCLTAFANDLSARTGVPVGVVPAPLAGSNLYAQWQRSAAFPGHRFTLYGSMLTRARRACPQLPPRGLLWFQGESDALDGRSSAQYLADLRTLAANLRADLGAPRLVFLCGQLGTYDFAVQPGWLGVQEAQRRFAAEDLAAALSPAVDLSRADSIHFDVPGHHVLGRRFALGARRLVHGEAVDPTNDVVAVTASVGSATAVLRYERPVAGGRSGLFRASDAGGANAVQQIAVAGDRVTLTFARPLGTGARLGYGFSSAVAEAWIVEVASGVPVPLFDALVLTP